MSPAAHTGLSADIIALTRVLLNIEAPLDQQQAARSVLIAPAAVIPLHPVSSPVAAPTQMAAFHTAPVAAPTYAPPAAPAAPAAYVDPIATPSLDDLIDAVEQAPAAPDVEETEPEAPAPPPPAAAAPSYGEDRAAARALLDQLSFLDD